MANVTSEGIATSNVTTVNTIAAADYVLVTANVSGNAKTRNITKQNLFTNGVHDGRFSNLYITFANTPANSTSMNVVTGHHFHDNNYLYIAIANNVVKRVALETF